MSAEHDFLREASGGGVPFNFGANSVDVMNLFAAHVAVACGSNAIVAEAWSTERGRNHMDSTGAPRQKQ